MGPSKVLETRSEADIVWLEAKPDCSFKVLGSSLDAKVSQGTIFDGDWLSKFCFAGFFNEIQDGVIAVVVKRGREYYPFFIGVNKSPAGPPKAVLDKVWASPVSRFGAIDVFEDGFCALRVRNEAGEICSTSPLTAESARILDGDLLCRYLLGLAGEDDLLAGIETSLAGPPGQRRLILTLTAGQRDAEDIKPQEPRAEERKTLKARLAEQDEQIARLEAELAGKEEQVGLQLAELTGWDKQVARQQAELEMLHAALASRDEQIAQKEADIADKLKNIRVLSQFLVEKEGLINQMSQRKQELIDEAINWEATAILLKHAIEVSWFFKYFPFVRGVLAKFPVKKQI